MRGSRAVRNLGTFRALSAARGMAAASVGVVTLLVAATGVFTGLRNALNVMFAIDRHDSAVRGYMRARVTAFALLTGFGFLLIVSGEAFATRYPLASASPTGTARRVRSRR